MKRGSLALKQAFGSFLGEAALRQAKLPFAYPTWRLSDPISTLKNLRGHEHVDMSIRCKVRLTSDDYRIIVEWMEVPENFAIVNMPGKKSTVGGARGPNKLDGFAKLAAHLAQYSSTPDLPRLSPYNMMQRWNTYKKRYAQADFQLTKPGCGLSPGEVAKGVTIKDKLKKICPHFARLKTLLDGPGGAVKYDLVVSTDQATPDESQDEHASNEAADPDEEVGSEASSCIEEDEASSNKEEDETETSSNEGSVPVAPVAAALSESTPAMQTFACRIVYLKEKLEHDKAVWAEERIQREHQREFEATQRRLDREDRERARMDEIVLELARQGKTPAEIQEYMGVISAFRAP